MHSTFTPQANGRMLAQIELDQSELKAAIELVRQQAINQLHIKGFRKGKVPPEQANQHLDEQALLQEALGHAVESGLDRAIQDEQLDVIDTADLEIKENSTERLVYTVMLDVLPPVLLPDLTEIKVERKTIEVPALEIDETFQSIQRSRAVAHPKDGPAAAGDRVEVDFEVRLDGQIIENGESKNHPVTIGEHRFIPGFEDALVGLAVGQHKEFQLTAPKDYKPATLAGKVLDFNVTMRKVEHLEIPEITDEFAKSLGRFDGVEALRKSVREGLRQEHEQHERQRLRGALLAAILAKVTIPVSLRLIERQLDRMIEQLDHDLHARGMELGLYLAQIHQTQDQLRDQWKEQAERQVREALLLRAIAKQKNLAPASADVESATVELVESLAARSGQAIDTIDANTVRQTVLEQLTNEGVFLFLERTCVVDPQS